MIPTVSIIIPVYNGAQYIDECINSIVSQEFKNWELILVNDGSTDNSGEICVNWQQKDYRIKYYYKENGGVSSARNFGLSQASGKYVVFVDSDDICATNLIKELVSHVIEDYNKYDMVACLYSRFAEYEEVIESNNSHGNIESLININSVYCELDKNNILHQPYCKLYLLTLIRKYKIKFDESLSLGEDLCFNLDYLHHIKTCRLIKKTLYYYRDTPKSLTKNININYADIQMFLFDRKARFLEVNNINYDWTPVGASIVMDMIMSICRSKASHYEKVEAINRIKHHRLVRNIAKPKGIKETVFIQIIKCLPATMIAKILR